MTVPRGGPVLLMASVVLLAGCGTGTDDELEPRPAETVTVTAEPEPTSVPERLPFGDAAPVQEVTWSVGTELLSEDAELDLATIAPETIVVVPGGLLILASGEVWFTAGREAVGQAFAAVTSLALSEDGTQVLVQPEDRDEPVAYDLADGTLVEDGATPARSADRIRRGPGEFRVVRRDAGAVVVDGAGAPVSVPGLPADFQVRGWVDGARPYGLGTGDGGGTPRVFQCDLDPAKPSCGVVGPLRGSRDPVFALHAAG